MKLAGLMVVFLGFAIAVLLNEDVLAGDDSRSINHRGTQLVFAATMLGLVARLLPAALLDLLDQRPAVRFDDRGGHVRTTVRRRRFRWDEVVAIERGPKSFKIRLARGRKIRVAGEFEGYDMRSIHEVALSRWTSPTRS